MTLGVSLRKRPRSTERFLNLVSRYFTKTTGTWDYLWYKIG